MASRVLQSKNDCLFGDLGNDTLIGVDPAASLPGLGEIDTLTGGAGNEILQPLAIVVLGGLFTSTILPLVVIPALYAKFGRWLIPKSQPLPVNISSPLETELGKT